MIDLNKKLIEIASKIANQISHHNKVIVTMDSNFDNDLVFDSLDSVEFIMEVEREFDIQISDDLAEEMTYKLKTLKDILPVLKEKYGIYDIKIERKEKLDEIDEKNKL